MKRMLVVVLLLLFCINAFAEEESKTVELEPIVVTPWRTQESYSDVSRNVTVITEKDIGEAKADYLPELIKEKTGVAVSNYLGNPKGTVVDIRGFGESSVSNVLVLIDGRKTNQVDLSGVDWGQIDVDSIERIEVVRGPATVLYGDNAASGVINIITKKGITEKPSISMSAELGSYKYHKFYGNISGTSKLSGEKDKDKKVVVDYFISSSNQETTGYRANNDYWASDYFGRFSLYPTEESAINLSSGYHRDHYGMPGALYLNGNPYALVPKGINQVGRRGTAFPDDRGFTSDGFLTAEPKFTLFFADNNAVMSVFASARERRSKGLNVPEADTWGTPHSEYETIHHIITYELRPKMETTILWKEIDNNLVAGIDYFHAKDDVTSGNRIGQQQDETVIYKETIGAYAHDNIKISKRIVANAGLRAEWADYTFNQKRLIVNHDTKQLKEQAANFGVGYKYNDKSQVYADISRSFRFPNTEEYYQNKYLNTWTGQVQGGLNTNIKHQQATNYEVGIKDITFDWMRLNADAFLMDVRDEIYYDPSSFLNTNYSPKVRHMGLEFDGRLELLDKKIKPFVNWTLQKSAFKGGIYTGSQVPFVPKNKLSSGLTLSPIKSLDWTTTLYYMGSRYKISDQKNIAPKLKDYATVDTTLSYKYKYVEVWGTLKNIFNKKYYDYGVTNSTGTSETFYPAQGRSAEAGMTVKF